jgi:group I intron endonuclease
MSCIYRLDIGNRFYYGSTTNIVPRVRAHLWRLKNNRHENKIMQNTYNKYGAVHVSIVAMGCWSKEELVRVEQDYLDGVVDISNCMNIAREANSPTWAGRTLSQEHKDKIGNAHRGRRHSDEARRNMSLAKQGVSRSVEAINKQKRSMVGKHQGSDNPMYGKSGMDSPVAKRVCVVLGGDKKIYDSMRAASEGVGVPVSTMSAWLNGYSKLPGVGRKSKYDHLQGIQIGYVK